MAGRNDDAGDWLAAGIRAGYCTEPYCSMHDGTWLTDDEAADMETGTDPCIIVVRLWAGR